MSDPIIRHSGRHLEFRETTEGWEYVVRSNAKGCIAVLAITNDGKVVLTEQYRPPVDGKVIELPAGLAGDIPLQEDEPLESAARRELKEETGYVAESWTKIWNGPSSAGLTSEVITIFQAEGLTRVHEGGGVGNEAISVHLVELSDVMNWCSDRVAEGTLVDFKVFAALFAARPDRGGRGGKARLWY